METFRALPWYTNSLCLNFVESKRFFSSNFPVPSEKKKEVSSKNHFIFFYVGLSVYLPIIENGADFLFGCVLASFSFGFLLFCFQRKIV